MVTSCHLNSPINAISPFAEQNPGHFDDKEYADLLLREIKNLNLNLSHFCNAVYEFEYILPYLRLDQVFGLPDFCHFLRKEKIQMSALEAPSEEEAIAIANYEPNSLFKSRLLDSIKEHFSSDRSNSSNEDSRCKETMSLEELEAFLQQGPYVYPKREPHLVQFSEHLPINNPREAASLLTNGYILSLKYPYDTRRILGFSEMIRAIPEELMANRLFIYNVIHSELFKKFYKLMRLSFLFRALSATAERFPDVQDQILNLLIPQPSCYHAWTDEEIEFLNRRPSSEPPRNLSNDEPFEAFLLDHLLG